MPFEGPLYSYKTSMHIVIVGFPSELAFRVSKGKVNSARPARSQFLTKNEKVKDFWL